MVAQIQKILNGFAVAPETMEAFGVGLRDSCSFKLSEQLDQFSFLYSMHVGEKRIHFVVDMQKPALSPRLVYCDC